jgi:hypothetical protein
VLVGVAFVEFVAAVADEDVLLGSSDGFSPPEHPAARIVKQTGNVIRMAPSIPEKQRRAFFYVTDANRGDSVVVSECEISACSHSGVRPWALLRLWKSRNTGAGACRCSALLDSSTAIDGLAS